MTGNARVARLVEVLSERSRPPGTPVTVLREDMESAVARMPLAEGVTVTPAQLGGRPAEWVAPEVARRDETLVWFHGGGYVMGSPATVRPMASILAAELGGPVLVPDYRLAPEHPFPAAVEDAVAVYEDLLGSGRDPRALAFGGDSAGGGLVLAAMVAARDRGLRQPAAGVCVSPWVDLASPGAAADDPQVTAERLVELSAWYLGGADPADPLASPIHADLGGLAPLLIQVGGAERLVDDGRRAADHATRDGVEVSFECWDDMIHVWHAFAPRLEEGTLALRRIAAWLAGHWDG